MGARPTSSSTVYDIHLIVRRTRTQGAIWAGGVPALRQSLLRREEEAMTGPADELRGLIGTELGVSEWMEISQERIERFADATDDHQWIHVDRERAAAGPFGTTIAHGFLTLSLLVSLAGQVALPVERPKMSINYGLDKVRFITPVPSGGRIRARVVLGDVTEVPGGVQVKRVVTMELEGSEKPAMVAEALGRLLW
jgi:acyl dehydratase